jgi:hypothetical protein
MMPVYLLVMLFNKDSHAIFRLATTGFTLESDSKCRTETNFVGPSPALGENKNRPGLACCAINAPKEPWCVSLPDTGLALPPIERAADHRIETLQAAGEPRTLSRPLGPP